MVRPILEYTVPVWCPYLVKNIRTLESIQRRASRLALNQHKGKLPYVDRCKLLKWPSLSAPRNYLSLIECYKFVFGYYHLNFYDFFEFSKVGCTRANHPFKLYVKSARLSCYKYSFFIGIVSKWNDLPRVIERKSADGERKKKDACVTNQGRAPKALLFFNQSDKSPDSGLRADDA